MRHSSPWLKVGLCVVVVVTFISVMVIIFSRPGNSSEKEAQAVETPSPATASQRASSVAPSSSPTPTAAACPTSSRLPDSTSLENRVFDFEEADIIPDPRKRFQALVNSGDPKGLATKAFLEDASPPPDDTSAPKNSELSELTYVLDRQQSQYEPGEVDSDGSITVTVLPVWTSCRNGKVVNHWAEVEIQTSTWVQENGVYRVAAKNL